MYVYPIYCMFRRIIEIFRKDEVSPENLETPPVLSVKEPKCCMKMPTTSDTEVFGKRYRDGYNKLWIENIRNYSP